MLLQFVGIGLALAEAPGDTSPQEDNVGSLPLGDRLGTQPLPLRGGGFFLGLDANAFLLTARQTACWARSAACTKSGRTRSISAPTEWISASSSGVVRPSLTISRSISTVRGSLVGGMRSRRPNHGEDHVGRPSAFASRDASASLSGANCAASKPSSRRDSGLRWATGSGRCVGVVDRGVFPD